MLNNNNEFTCYTYRISNYIYQISFLSLLVLFFFSLNINNLTIFGQKSDSDFSEHEDINIVSAGDYYCNDETEDTIENIISVDPELIITTGDHVKDEKSAKCWIQMSEPIKDKMKIAIGNHDAEFSKIYKQIIKNHNLKSPYYSHDFKNIHFISLSTEHPYEEGSKQYKFIKNDLKISSTNSSIDWIIIHQHKPLYSTNADIEESERIKDTFLPLFEKYGVDFVISGHNQYYERSYPMSYNKVIGLETKDQESMPELTKDDDDDSKSIYENTNGIIYLTVGTAGDELQQIKKKDAYYIIQKGKYGFLNLKLENSGKTIIGEFHTNNDKILDNFKVKKS
ncbi:MAG TPA: metallophosphoesterase [Nitrososphaeraceae archaeon]